VTGLREYERDLSVPGLLGDGSIRLPESDEILEWIGRWLVKEGAPSPCSASISHARWKPGVSCVGTWRIRFDDDSERIVVLKSYTGDKALEKAERGAAGTERHFEDDRMLPFALLPELGARLWTFPADRSLVGAARVMDAQRSARLLDRLGVTSPWTTKGSLSVSKLLRYKPERRVVTQFSARLHRPAPKPRMREFILRALTPEESAVSAHARATLHDAGAPSFVPMLLGHEATSGILVEEFVEGVARDPEDFSAPEKVGGLLAQLHGLPILGMVAPEYRPSKPSRLLDVDASLLRMQPVAEPEPSGAVCWMHGDLHPDQIMEGPAGESYLMDMDALGVGDPAHDLASWIADALACDQASTFEQASEGLLTGYLEGGGQVPRRSDLMRHTASALQRRATGCLRRLEANAVELARTRMERAWELMGSSGGQA